jgi:hypothetical protein
MHGYPLETSKALLDKLIGALRPSDTFNVMLFSGSNRMLAPASVPATRANIDRALQTIREMGGGGSTEIVPALRRIAALPKAPDVSRSVIVVTDGYVTVENEVFQLVRRNLGQANVFAFGIGSSVNRHLIEGIARAGQGEAFIVTKPEEAAAQAERLRRMIESPVLTQVKAQVVGLDTYDTLPAQLPDVLGGRPVVVYGKFRGAPDAGARLIVEGRSAEGAWRGEAGVEGRDDKGAPALRYLWARQRIAMLSDQEALEGGNAQKEAITALGLQYSLLTQYTSFIAVDHVVRRSEPGLVDDGEAAVAHARGRQQPGDRRRGAEHARGRRLDRPDADPGDRRRGGGGRASPLLKGEWRWNLDLPWLAAPRCGSGIPRRRRGAASTRSRPRRPGPTRRLWPGAGPRGRCFASPPSRSPSGRTGAGQRRGSPMAPTTRSASLPWRCCSPPSSASRRACAPSRRPAGLRSRCC